MKLYKVMGGIGALAVLLLLLSYPFRNDEHGVKWILGGIGWIGFMLCVLALIAIALGALGRSVYRKVTVG